VCHHDFETLLLQAVFKGLGDEWFVVDDQDFFSGHAQAPQQGDSVDCAAEGKDNLIIARLGLFARFIGHRYKMLAMRKRAEEREPTIGPRSSVLRNLGSILLTLLLLDASYKPGRDLLSS
jgi:hypothetical protein